MKKLAIVTLVLVLATPVLAAEKSVEQTVPAAPDGEVSIELIAGSVRVTAWDRDEVKITGTIDDEYEELEIDADGEDVTIEVDLLEHDDGRWTVKSAANLEIVVPAGVELGIETISAELSVDGVSGSVGIESVSGGIELRGAMREVEVESISGKIDVIAEGALRFAEIETVAGDIELRGALGPDARLSLESVNGNITLRLPSGTSAEFGIETFNGDIENAFGPEATKSSDFLPSKELSFSLGRGDARVEIASFNGTIRLVEE